MTTSGHPLGRRSDRVYCQPIARAPRILATQIPFHVIARGNGDQVIFKGDRDWGLFAHLLATVLRRYSWTCHAYCLMQTHYHLVLEPTLDNLPRGMQHLNSLYAQRFNSRHGRHGHVFAGRYRSIPVVEEQQMLEVCRYVVLNPVRAGMCTDPGEWRWSSYRGIVGRTHDPLVAESRALGGLGSGPGVAREDYRRFVLEAL